MKTLIRSFLAAGLLLGMTTLRAEDTPAKPSADAKKPAAGQAAKHQLTSEQRKEAQQKSQAKLKHLREKKANGTLTDAEKTQLEKMEKRASAHKEAAGKSKKHHDPADKK